jgi:starch synthase
MKILMVAAEMSPLAKVGGLADVTGALPAALAARGHDLRLVLPLYGHLDPEALGIEPLSGVGPVPVRVGQRMLTLRYWTWTAAPAGVQVLPVSCGDLFTPPGVYGDASGRPFADHLDRAGALSLAAVMLPELLDWPVDVLHAHDAQAALAPVYRHRWYGDRGLPGRAGTLLTIHNLAHQEIHPASELPRVGLPVQLAEYPGPFEFFGRLNLLKAGIMAAELVNTVSPAYAREVVGDPELGCGLGGVLASRGEAFTGILNGIDDSAWNPARDPWIAAPYTAADLSGKQRCRDALLREAKLETGARPVLGLVSRLVPQKGVDLVTGLLDRLVAGGFSLVALGTGDPDLHAALEAGAAAHPGRVAFLPGFSEALAHRIYAGSDLFLMPSRFEPCGLSQLYALRYGTPPVVRATGGLADTVRPAAQPEGTGFVFPLATAESLWGALEEARALFADREAWRRLQRRGMACDFGWDLSAAGYEDLYRRLAPGAGRARAGAIS